MQTFRSEVLPPSGVQYTACLKLLPSLVTRRRADADGATRTAVCNLVVAFSNLLRIFEIVEEPLSFQSYTAHGGGKGVWNRVRKDTDPVEGEVEMDVQGEGFVNMGAVKVALYSPCGRIRSVVVVSTKNVLTHPYFLVIVDGKNASYDNSSFLLRS